MPVQLQKPKTAQAKAKDIMRLHNSRLKEAEKKKRPEMNYSCHEAIAVGATTYSTKEPCPKCGTFLKYCSNRTCLQCNRNRKKLKYQRERAAHFAVSNFQKAL
jgi:hypothetical protein